MSSNKYIISFLIDFEYKYKIINKGMANLNPNYDFNNVFDSVLDSQRAKQKRLVDPSYFRDSQDLQQNIKIAPSSQPKILSSDLTQNKQASLPLTGQSYDLNKAVHPTICILTLAFKASAFIIYLLIGNFISSILTFIFVLILSALDFWFVKNVSGRLLVGLRWRSQYDINGKQIWKFQSYDNQFKSNSVDKMFFWASQVGFTAVWGILLLLNILTFDLFWAFLLMITTGLCGINLYGYYQCRGQHKKKIEGLKKQYGKKIFRSVAQRFV